MLVSEVEVKGLDAERGGVARKPIGSHQRERSESANVAVVNGTSIAEPELDRGIRSFAIGEVAVVDEQSAGEAWLHDEMVAGAQVEHDELRTSPAARDGGSRCAPRELSR